VQLETSRTRRRRKRLRRRLLTRTSRISRRRRLRSARPLRSARHAAEVLQGSRLFTRSLMNKVAGFIAAGRGSSRMGTDKAWLEIDGRPMIQLVIEAVRDVCSTVSVIANESSYERLGLPVFRDTYKGIGPLEAIRTALANSSEDRALVVACDL